MVTRIQKTGPGRNRGPTTRGRKPRVASRSTDQSSIKDFVQSSPRVTSSASSSKLVVNIPRRSQTQPPGGITPTQLAPHIQPLNDTHDDPDRPVSTIENDGHHKFRDIKPCLTLDERRLKRSVVTTWQDSQRLGGHTNKTAGQKPPSTHINDIVTRRDSSVLRVHHPRPLADVGLYRDATHSIARSLPDTACDGAHVGPLDRDLQWISVAPSVATSMSEESSRPWPFTRSPANSVKPDRKSGVGHTPRHVDDTAADADGPTPKRALSTHDRRNDDDVEDHSAGSAVEDHEHVVVAPGQDCSPDDAPYTPGVDMEELSDSDTSSRGPSSHPQSDKSPTPKAVTDQSRERRALTHSSLGNDTGNIPCDPSYLDDQDSDMDFLEEHKLAMEIEQSKYQERERRRHDAGRRTEEFEYLLTLLTRSDFRTSESDRYRNEAILRSVHFMLREYRADVVTALCHTKSIDENRFSDEVLRTFPFCHDGFASVMTNGFHQVDGHRTKWRDPDQVFDWIWGAPETDLKQPKFQRKHFENKRFRVWMNTVRCHPLLKKEIKIQIRRRLEHEFFRYHWLVPHPDMNGTLISTAKTTGLRQFYATEWDRIPGPSASNALANPPGRLCRGNETWVWIKGKVRSNCPRAYPEVLTTSIKLLEERWFLSPTPGVAAT